MASLRNVPSATVPPSGVQQLGLGGHHRDAAGLLGGDHGRCAARSPRRRCGWRRPTRPAPMRRIMSGAVTGSSASSPNGLLPGCTCSRLVPSSVELGQQVGPARRRDADHRHHGGDADGDAERGEQRAAAAWPAGRRCPRRPRRSQRLATAPRLDRGADGAAARPGAVTLRHLTGPSAAGRRRPVASRLTSTPSPRRRRDPPSRTATHRGMPAATCGSWVMSTIVDPGGVQRAGAGRAISAPVAESRLPVGSSASTIAGSPTMARAMATRWRSPPDSCGRPVRGPVAEADAGQSGRGPLAPVVGRQRRGRAARWPRCRARVSPSSRWNCWNTKPMRRARSADSSRSFEAHRCRPPPPAPCPTTGRSRAPIEVEQGRLARPRRPDDGDHLARLDREGHPVEGPDRRGAGVLLHDVGEGEDRRSDQAASGSGSLPVRPISRNACHVVAAVMPAPPRRRPRRGRR